MVTKNRHSEIPIDAIKGRKIPSDGIRYPRTEYLSFEKNIPTKNPLIKVWIEVDVGKEGQNYCYTRLVRKTMPEYNHQHMRLINLQKNMGEVA